MSTGTLDAIWGTPISAYTRADALRDGALVTLDPGLSLNFRISAPVAITRAA